MKSFLILASFLLSLVAPDQMTEVSFAHNSEGIISSASIRDSDPDLNARRPSKAKRVSKARVASKKSRKVTARKAAPKSRPSAAAKRVKTAKVQSKVSRKVAKANLKAKNKQASNSSLAAKNAKTAKVQSKVSRKVAKANLNAKNKQVSNPSLAAKNAKTAKVQSKISRKVNKATVDARTKRVGRGDEQLAKKIKQSEKANKKFTKLAAKDTAKGNTKAAKAHALAANKSARSLEDEKYKAKVNTIDDAIVGTAAKRKNGSIFWTQGGMTQAEEMANKKNAKKGAGTHSSLEMIANKKPVNLPNGTATPEQGKLWNVASDKFAESASGKTRIVMGTNQWRQNNVFNTVEKPILTKPLSQGGKVTQINVYETDPKTGKVSKTHRWKNDGTPWDGPGSNGVNGDYNKKLAPK